jgi:type II secretory pathway pseudopilin PulG
LFCANCGWNNPDKSAFCSKCGQKVTARGEATASSIAKTDGKAVVSLILGILSVTVLWILAGIPAVILGHISRASIRRSMGELKGAGMALAGLIMGYLSIAAIPFVLIVASIAIPSLLRARQAAQESAAVSNLRTINTAEFTYGSSEGGRYGTLPQLINAGLLDPRYTTSVSGYDFSVTLSGSDYLATATPVSANTGRYGYMSTRDAVVRYQTESTSTCIPCFPIGQAGGQVQ